jgi:hypothetical protein
MRALKHYPLSAPNHYLLSTDEYTVSKNQYPHIRILIVVLKNADAVNDRIRTYLKLNLLKRYRFKFSKFRTFKLC